MKSLAVYKTTVLPASASVSLSLQRLVVGSLSEADRSLDPLISPTITSLDLVLPLGDKDQDYSISILERVVLQLHHLSMIIFDNLGQGYLVPRPPSLLKILKDATALESFHVILSGGGNVPMIISALPTSLISLRTGGHRTVDGSAGEVARAQMYLKLMDLPALKHLRSWTSTDVFEETPREGDVGRWFTKCEERGIEVRVQKRLCASDSFIHCLVCKACCY